MVPSGNGVLGASLRATPDPRQAPGQRLAVILEIVRPQVSRRSIVSARASRQGRGAIPNARATAVQSSRVSGGRAAAVGYSLVRIGTTFGVRPSRSAAISTIARANSNQLASPQPAK